jgi:hypothetical protein
MNATNIIRSIFILWLAATTASISYAQINATTNTGWTAWRAGGVPMEDVAGDQQTGQGQDDFVGDSTTYAMQSQAGVASYGDFSNHLFFRARMDKFTAADQWGNGGNWGIGMDLDGDGDLDMIMMFTEGAGKAANRTRQIQFGTAGTGLNDGPSTTSWTFPTQTAITLTTNEGYDLQEVTTGTQFNGTTDAWLTFGLSFAQLQTAIRSFAYDSDGTSNFSNYNLSYDSRIAFISFTSTQDGVLNQDLAGISGNTGGSNSFADFGAITPPMGPGGYIPEPGTYLQLGVLLLFGGVVMYRRNISAQKSKSKAPPA